MFNVEKIQSSGIDKLAFLGLLIIGLSAAALLVAARQGPSMSEPLWFNEAGIGASVPAGRGWRFDRAWRGDGDGFVLAGALSRHGGSTLLAGFYCFPDSPYNPEDFFRRELFLFGGQTVHRGMFSAAGVSVPWIHIANPRGGLHVYFGTAALPGGLRLNIEVQQLSEHHQGQAIFEALLRGIRLKQT